MPQLRAHAVALGFADVGVSHIDLTAAEQGLLDWLAQGYHGQMDYMQRHGLKRARPAELVPGTLSVITARMNYLPAHRSADWIQEEWQRLDGGQDPVVSLYARGRDYHKVVRQRLQTLSQWVAKALQPHDEAPVHTRVFSDSAPVMEVALASQSGLGWRGKHTLLIHRDAGSLFFLGDIYVNVALEPTPATTDHCGSCEACLSVCPTGAIVAPYQLDARRCISYLTIEHAGPIPLELRPLIGNRIYGCDDCQLACPWNKYAQPSAVPDFDDKPIWHQARLWDLMAWSEEEFLKHTEGTSIRRIGHERWLRNVALAMGNALGKSPAPDIQQALMAALQARQHHTSAVVREQVQWAVAQAL